MGAGDPGGVPTTWGRVAAMANPLTGGAQRRGALPWSMGRMTCGNRAKCVCGVGVPECPNVPVSFPGASQAGFSLAPQVAEGTAVGPILPPHSPEVSERLGPGAGMLGLLGVSVTRVGPG